MAPLKHGTASNEHSPPLPNPPDPSGFEKRCLDLPAGKAPNALCTAIDQYGLHLGDFSRHCAYLTIHG